MFLETALSLKMMLVSIYNHTEVDRIGSIRNILGFTQSSYSIYSRMAVG